MNAGTPDPLQLLDDLDARFASESSAFERAELASLRDLADDDAAECLRRAERQERPALDRALASVFLGLLEDPEAVETLARRHGAILVDTMRARVATAPVGVEPVLAMISAQLETYRTTFADARMAWRGESLPLHHVTRTQLDPDAEPRRDAFASYVAALVDRDDVLADVFDRLLEARATLAGWLGFASYTELRYLEMRRFDWSPDDARTFRDAVWTHLVPIARTLRQAQASALGSTLLHPADVEIHPGSPARLAIDVAEEPEALARVARAIHPTIGGVADLLIERGRIDHVARPNKSAGASCTWVEDEGFPFVFANATGAARDATTLAHELGHAVQYALSAGCGPALLRLPSLDLQEVHSTTLEFLARQHAETFFGDDASRYRDHHLRDSIVALPYVCAVDEFQHVLYCELPDRRGREDLWQRLASVWMPDVDWEVEPWWWRNRWVAQRHLYNSPLYYLDYALAQVVAWQLWLDGERDPDSTVARYVKLCSLGGTVTLRQAATAVGLDDPFEPGTVARVARELATRPNVADR